MRLGPILGLWWAAGTGRPGSPGQTVLEVHSGHDAAMQVLAQLRADAERPTRGSWANGRAPGPGAQQQTGYHRPNCGSRTRRIQSSGAERQVSALNSPGHSSRNSCSVRTRPHSHFRVAGPAHGRAAHRPKALRLGRPANKLCWRLFCPSGDREQNFKPLFLI